MDTFLEVLKWTGIALAAGFVGYFGRFPAKILIVKISGHRKNSPEKPPTRDVDDTSVAELKNHRKIEKKKAKNATKTAKKTDKT